MLRTSAFYWLALTLALPASAQTYRIESSPVGVTSENSVKALTAEWDDVAAANTLVATAVIERLRQDHAYDYWTFVAARRPTTIHVAISEPSPNQVEATLTVTTDCDSGEIRFQPATIFTAAEIIATGWPAPSKAPAEVAARVRTRLFTADNVAKLWLLLRNCAEVGKLALWHSDARAPQPMMMVLPIQWTDHFDNYNCVVRAKAGSSIIYGASTFGAAMVRKAAVNDAAGFVDTGLVAYAECVYANDHYTAARKVPAILKVKRLEPVYLEEKARGKLRPASAQCSVLENLQ